MSIRIMQEEKGFTKPTLSKSQDSINTFSRVKVANFDKMITLAVCFDVGVNNSNIIAVTNCCSFKKASKMPPIYFQNTFMKERSNILV